MLTNLDWLKAGAPYPPAAENDRIKRYELNEQLFNTQHKEAWKELFEELARRLKRQSVELQVVLNYQQKLSVKTADFVCGETPTIETEQDTDALLKVLDAQRWASKLYEAFIDVSRFGNAVPKIVGKKLTAVSPRYWYPVVSSTDLKEITQHVIAYPITPDDKGAMTELYVEIHDIGRIHTQIYGYDADKKEIGKLKSQDAALTGLSDFAVQPLTNLTSSSSVYGIDDYAVVNSLVSQLIWRLSRIDKVLDKHSEPSVSGPSSALSYDQRTGLYFLDLGNYFKRESDTDVDVKYITWDGNLESSFEEIKSLLDQLRFLSEMGPAISDADGGQTDSGEALKLRMVSPRTKAARLVNLNAGTVKQIITLLAQVNGVQVDYAGLTLHWSDGLPMTDREQYDNLSIATGGQPIMSQYAAMKRLGLSDAEVEAELEQMDEERSGRVPALLGVVDKPAEEEDDPNDDTENK
jgi:hypothetical protein